MKHLVLILFFIVNTISAQEAYFNENFETVVIPDGQSSTVSLPSGWSNYNSLKVVKFPSTHNQYIVFYNFEPNIIFGVGMPELFIRPNSVLKFKAAITNKTQPGKLEIKTFKGTEAIVIGTVSFDDIAKRDREFTDGNPTSKFEHEIDLSAYAGETLQLHFEMTAEKQYLQLGLDDIQLISRNTLSLQDLKKPQITIYPNPAYDYVQVTGIVPIKNSLFGSDGRLVKKSDSDRIEMADLPNGIYFLKTIDSDGNHYINKIIKK